MRWFITLLILAAGLTFGTRSEAAQARIVKVLPHFIDKEGRNTLSPSLYERDAYQAELRKNPEKCSGMRFDVQWKSRGYDLDTLKMKVEIRASKGNDSKVYVVEQPVHPRGIFTYWDGLPFKGDEYKQAGTVNAWRVTLWSGDQQVAEQKSFLW